MTTFNKSAQQTELLWSVPSEHWRHAFKGFFTSTSQTLSRPSVLSSVPVFCTTSQEVADTDVSSTSPIDDQTPAMCVTAMRDNLAQGLRAFLFLPETTRKSLHCTHSGALFFFFFFTCQPLCYFQSMKYGSMNSKLMSLFTSSFITYLCINTSAYVSVLKLLVMSVYMCYWNVTCNFHIIVLNQRNNQGFILIIVPEAYYTPFHTSGATLSKLVLLFALAASATKK